MFTSLKIPQDCCSAGLWLLLVFCLSEQRQTESDQEPVLFADAEAEMTVLVVYGNVFQWLGALK